MGNPSSVFDFDNETLSQLLARSIDNGTFSNLFVSLKVDPEDQPAAATDIIKFFGQLYGNALDDFLRDVYQRLNKGTKLFGRTNLAALQALGSDDDQLIVGSIGWTTGDLLFYKCDSITGPGSSTWSVTAGGGGAAYETVADIDLTAESNQDIKAGGDGPYTLDAGLDIEAEQTASSTSFDITNGSGVVIVAAFNGDFLNTTRTASLFTLSFAELGLDPQQSTRFMVDYELTNFDTDVEAFVFGIEHNNLPNVNNVLIFDQKLAASPNNRRFRYGRTTAGSTTLATEEGRFNSGDPRGLAITSDAPYADFRFAATAAAGLPISNSADWQAFSVAAVAASIGNSFDRETGRMFFACRSLAANTLTLTVKRIRVITARGSDE